MGITAQCLGLLLLAGAEMPAWDAVRAFHAGAEPSGEWSYGYSVPGKQPFTVHNTAGKTSEGLACWWTDNWTTVGGVLAKSPDKGPSVINGFHFAPVGSCCIRDLRIRKPRSASRRP